MPKTLSAAYLAGLFDGEGCVRAHECVQHGVRTVQCEIQIANTHEGIIRQIADQQGGSYRLQRQGGKLGKHQVWSYRLTGAKAEAFARLILPHAVIKREQLAMFLALRATIVRAGRTPVSEERWAARRELIQAIKDDKRAHLVPYEAAA